MTPVEKHTMKPYDDESDVLAVYRERVAEANAFKRRSIFWGVLAALLLVLPALLEQMPSNSAMLHVSAHFAGRWASQSAGQLIGLAVIVTFIACCVQCEMNMIQGWRLRENALMLRDSLSDRGAIQEAISGGGPFALYLRDYSVDRHKTVMRPLPGGASSRDTTPHFEDSLASLIGQHLEIVGLLNIDEEYPAFGIRRVFVPDEEWFTRVVEYARHATLIIVCVDQMTEPLWREIEALESIHASDRLFLSITESVHRALSLRYPSLIAAARWVSVRGARTGRHRVESVDAPADLLEWLNTVTARPASHFSMMPLR